MASIFNLKSWVSLDDAAKHLNPFFDEEIEVKDLLRLVLDGHLQLSINFVNHTYGALGQAVGKDELQESDWEEMELPFSGKQYVLMLHDLYNDKWLREKDQKKLQSITGVWDLTIAGHGLYEVEHLYYLLSNGTGVTKDTLGGIEVTQGNKTFVIYEPFHADKKKAEECQRERYEKKNEYLNKNNLPSEVFHFNYYDRRDWYPSGVIPDDAIWCIRTNELTRFVQSQIQPTPEPQEIKDLNPTERDALHNIIKALANMVIDPTAPKEKEKSDEQRGKPPFKNQTQLIEFLSDKESGLGEWRGLSKPNLEKVFAKANKTDSP